MAEIVAKVDAALTGLLHNALASIQMAAVIPVGSPDNAEVPRVTSGIVSFQSLIGAQYRELTETQQAIIAAFNPCNGSPKACACAAATIAVSRSSAGERGPLSE